MKKYFASTILTILFVSLVNDMQAQTENREWNEGFVIPKSWTRQGLVIERYRADKGVSGDPCIVWDEDIRGWRMVLFYDPWGAAQAICTSFDNLGPGQWKVEGPLNVANPEVVGGFHKPFIVMDPYHANHAAKIEGRYCLLVVNFKNGHKQVQRAWSEKLAGPWTFEPQALITTGDSIDFDGRHADTVTGYYFPDRKEFLYFYKGYPFKAQPRKVSPFGSAQAVATQKLGEAVVTKRGIVLEPEQKAGHWASGWVGGLQLMRGRDHRWIALVNASPTAPDYNVNTSGIGQEPPPSQPGFAWCDEEWPVKGWHFAPEPIEWVKDIPKFALDWGEGYNLWRHFIHILPDGRAAMFYNSGYYGKEQLYMKISDEPFQPLPARIVPVSQVESTSAPTVLTRLENKKLALMVRNSSGRMKPFYVRGIETGFYDTRNQKDINWEQVFAGYQSMGANTAMFMVHWQDIEPEPGKYDFTFIDKIVATAKKYDVKIWWVLFMRCSIGDPVSGSNAWVYRFLNKDGVDHSIQWIKKANGEFLNNADAYLKTKTRIYPEFAHPEVFSHINSMLDALGRHYRNSPDVLGVQIGNEEGFNDAGEGDFNPAAIALFEQWKNTSGKTDETQFKMEINKYWWQRFTTTFHRADPYKLTSYNLLGGGPEAGDEKIIRRMGVDCSIYGDGNLDVIGTMFYHAHGPQIWPNLDRQYKTYVYDLPILVPSEIGLGPKWGPQVQFQTYAINAIERGAQGYSAYCYGELIDSIGKPNAFGQSYRKFADMVQANEDLIYAGVPGPGDVSMDIAVQGAKLSQLHRDPAGTLGILYFPNAFLQKNPDANTNAVDVTVELKTTKSGKYKVEVYRNGALQSSAIRQLKAGQAIRGLILSGVRETEAIFLRITRQNNK